MPIFGQEIFEKAQAKGALTDAAYLKARADARRLAGKDGLLAALDKNNLDALIAPSMSPAWPTDHVLGDHFVGAGYGVAAVAGTPSITVPMGDVGGLADRTGVHGPRLQRARTARLRLRLRAGTKARKPPSTCRPSSPDARLRTADRDSGLGRCGQPDCLRTISIAISSDCS